MTYNEGVSKIPGVYNPEGTVEFSEVDTKSDNYLCGKQAPYDFFNLTSVARTQAL